MTWRLLVCVKVGRAVIDLVSQSDGYALDPDLVMFVRTTCMVIRPVRAQNTGVGDSGTEREYPDQQHRPDDAARTPTVKAQSLHDATLDEYGLDVCAVALLRQTKSVAP
jgi:hypothetical protein